MISGNSVSRRIAAFALSVGLTWAHAAADETPKAPAWTLNQLMTGLSQIKSAKADFVEDQYLKMLTKPLRSSGVLVYVAPNRLEKITTAPKQQSVIIDGGEITIRVGSATPRTMKLEDNPQIGLLVESLRSTLNGDLPELKKFGAVQLAGNADHWQMTLAPTDPRLQKFIRTITITGERFSLNTVEILQEDGDRSVMRLADRDG
jgi:outer membrane lipoprotein-sorting protein